MRKRLALLAAATMLAVISIVPATASGQCNPVRYKQYENPNFGGHGLWDCVSRPDLREVEWGWWAWEDYDDMISSVQAVQWVQYYDGYNYNAVLVFYGAGANVAFVGNNLNDRFSSVWNGFVP